MIASHMVDLILVIGVLICGARIDGIDALSMNYYDMHCPFAEMIVRGTVNQAFERDPTLVAPLLRLHFHDCFVQGCDGSVLLDSTEDNIAEKESFPNLSLRGFEVIDQVKNVIEDHCPGVVSCADIVAMVARDAVFWAGGPLYDIPKGRKDGRRSKIADTINLPSPTLNSTSLAKMFDQHGLNLRDLVALSGGHTLGVAKCLTFENRLSNFDTTHDVDPTLDPNFAERLLASCSAGNKTEVGLDWTRNSFDNAYFSALQMGAGVLSTDQTLFTSPWTQVLVNAYAMNQAMFFFDFSQAMVKMGYIKEDDEGEVRKNCRKIN